MKRVMVAHLGVAIGVLGYYVLTHDVAGLAAGGGAWALAGCGIGIVVTRLDR